MAPKRPKRPRDPSQLAKRILDLATGESEEVRQTRPSKGKDPAAVALGRKGGYKGGKSRAARLSEAERSRIAAHAARTRWGHKDGESES